MEPPPLPVFMTSSRYRLIANVAVTAVAAATVTVHVPVPLQPPPLQPANVDPVDGVAVSVTVVPVAYGSLQSAPQLMPAGDDVTVPSPVPAFVTDSVWTSANVAVTVVSAVTETEQVPVPVQPPPLQPVNTEPAAGVAVSVNVEPLRATCEQVEPQLMDPGDDVTVPAPVPALATASVHEGRWKLAPTIVSAVIVTVHVPVPLQPPPFQPPKIELVAGVAVSVTTVP